MGSATDCIQVAGSNLAGEQIFFPKIIPFAYTFLNFSFDNTVTWHSKHASKRDLNEIKRTSSGNSTVVIANGYLLSFVLYSALKAQV